MLQLAALGSAGALVAACTPAAPAAPATTAPQAPKAEAPKAEEVKPTEAPAAAPAAIKPPIEFPEKPPINLGGEVAKRLPINQIVTYKALPEYKQPAWLDKVVAEGKLPPVKDRLPKEPQVVLTSGMKDGPGEYGDVWRGFSACPTAGWNNYAGVSAGWFGIESYSTNNSALFKTGPLFRADSDIEPFPNTAKSWKWVDDDYALEIKLIEGAKWSDGVPFTADDVIWTWEAYVLDDKVNSGRKLSAYRYGDKDAKLEKIDDYTIKFTFGAKKPLDVFYQLGEYAFVPNPKHALAEFHPNYSTKDPKPTYKDFENALPADKLPIPTMGPWVPTEYKTDELMILRRNPYFWKVDEKGQQLPYFDEIQYKKGPSGIGRDLCTMAGDCDHTNLENPSSYINAMAKAQEPDAKFSIVWGPELLSYGVEFNYAETLGTANDRDRAVRQLNRNLKFRKALSYATDRDGIAQAILRGPILRGYAGGIYPGSPEFDRLATVYYPYDVASAKALLDEIGVKDSDGDGVREFPDGPEKGKPIILQILTSEDAAETQSVAEALVNQWGAIGIKLNTRVINSTTWTEINTASTWDIRIYRGGQEYALPFTNATALAPIDKSFGLHRQDGDTPRKFMDFENTLIELVNKYRATFDSAERKKIMSEYQKVFTTNVYHLGIVSGHYGLGLAKRVKNIPVASPTFLYTWVEDAIMLEQLWTPAADQLKQNRPETYPVYTK